MKYTKGTFVVVPNKEYLKGKPSEMQTLYFWICSYANEDGQCFPSRTRLAKEVGCNVRTIDKYMKVLIDEGFIIKQIRKVEGGKQNLSNIYTLMLLEENTEFNLKYPERAIAEVETLTPPYVEKGATLAKGLHEGSQPNSTVTLPLNSTNLTTNNTDEKEVTEPPTPITTQTSLTLPVTRGKTSIQRVASIYSDLFYHKYNLKPKIDFKVFGSKVNMLLGRYSEIQIAFYLAVYFNWKGMNGADEKENSFLQANTFSFNLFSSTITKYEVYSKNILGLDIDSDSVLYSELAQHIRRLS